MSIKTPVKWQPQHYQLLDFGEGRKLEQFGTVRLDRACPAAEYHRKSLPAEWTSADAVLTEQGQLLRGSVPTNWTIQFGGTLFTLKLTPFGHVGVFPEQAENWAWIQSWIQNRSTMYSESDVRCLNLFAYTGGTTFAMAQAGATVAHVDASAPAVRWARENAEASQLDELPVRWLVEDAAKFVARELKRGNSYDLIALDPPSYGHGPKGQRWNIAEHLAPLLEQCALLLRENGRILLSAHSHHPNLEEAKNLYRNTLGRQPTAGRLELQTNSGRKLDAGYYCR